MANKRMFSNQITDADAFIDMPLSTQALYFHLCMHADDDGFIANPKSVQRLIGASPDDLKLLIAKRFMLAFESGVIVCKHWRINNYIQKDRYKPTVYTEEKSRLIIKDNGAYTDCIQNVDGLDAQTRQDKIRLEKNRLDKTTTPKLLSERLSNDEAERLAALINDPHLFIEFIDYVDGLEAPDVNKPYSYCLQIARNRGYI